MTDDSEMRAAHLQAGATFARVTRQIRHDRRPSSQKPWSVASRVTVVVEGSARKSARRTRCILRKER